MSNELAIFREAVSYRVLSKRELRGANCMGEEMSAQDMLILPQIEELRDQMNRAALERSLSDPVLIEMSQRLDNLLNRYQQIGSLIGVGKQEELFPCIEKGRAANAALI